MIYFLTESLLDNYPDRRMARKFRSAEIIPSCIHLSNNSMIHLSFLYYAPSSASKDLNREGVELDIFEAHSFQVRWLIKGTSSPSLAHVYNNSNTEEPSSITSTNRSYWNEKLIEIAEDPSYEQRQTEPPKGAHHLSSVTFDEYMGLLRASSKGGGFGV